MKQTVIYIDNRVDHVVDFESNGTETHTYVIKSNNEDSQEIFRFYSCENDNHLILQENLPQATEVIVKEIQKERENSYVITLEQADKNDKFDKEICCDSIKYLSKKDNSGKRYWLVQINRENRNQEDDLEITFKYSSNRTDCHSVRFYIVPAEQICDTVLDFGSEASQMAQSRRSDTWTINSLTEIFENMFQIIKGRELNDDEDVDNYDQCDAGNRRLFRSIFYAKKKISPDEENTNSVVPTYESQNSVLNILTTAEEAQAILRPENEAQKFILLPNIKLAHFGGIAQPKINRQRIADYRDNYFYRASLNNFILSAFSSANVSYSNISALTIHVLMPNVYDQYAIFKNLNNLRKDIREIIASNPRINARIRHFEVATISESDASLLGALGTLESERRLQNGKYLILDAGKGTLDYSVIDVNSNRQDRYHSIYRGGIIGAGNVLTTAYTMALLHDFAEDCKLPHLSERELVLLMMKNILGINNNSAEAGDISLLSKLTKATESYKAAISSTEYTGNLAISEPSHLESKEDLSLSQFVEYVKKHVDESKLSYKALSQAAERYIQSAVNLICDKVLENLQEVLPHLSDNQHHRENTPPVDGVLFSGRGFKLKQFKDTMLKQLLQKNLIRSEDCNISYLGTHTAANEKNICLYVSPILNKGQYDSFRASMFHKTRKQGTIASQNESLLAGISKKISGWFSKTPKESGTSFFDTLSILQSKGDFNDDYLSMSRYMAYGVEVNIQSLDDRVIIGGTKYKPEVLNQQTIFFTSNKIVMRSERGEVKEITPDEINLTTSSLVIPTLFPIIDRNVDRENLISSFCEMLTYDRRENHETCSTETRPGLDTSEPIEVEKPSSTVALPGNESYNDIDELLKDLDSQK